MRAETARDRRPAACLREAGLLANRPLGYTSQPAPDVGTVSDPKIHPPGGRRVKLGFSKILCATLLTLASPFVGVAAAQQSQGEEEVSIHGRNGAYLGLGGSVLWSAGSRPTSSDDSIGLNTRLGYRIWKYTAVEAEFEWSDELDGSEHWALGANAKGYFTTGAVQPYALLGLAYYEVGNTSDLGVRFGGGVDIYLSQHFYVNTGLNYVWGTGDLSDIDYFTLQWGAGYKF